MHTIHYQPNGGKGVALRRGMAWAQEQCPDQDIIITADSDGQHTVRDVLRMCESLSQNSDGLLLGSRDFTQPDVPFKSRNGNRITSAVFKRMGGRHPNRSAGLPPGFAASDASGKGRPLRIRNERAD